LSINKQKLLKPVRVLQVFSTLDRGGSETMVMNLYRNIDRTKVQFDFIVHTDKKCAYDSEIMTLGGKIYRLPRYSIINFFKYFILWRKFFQKYQEYKIIHGHYFTFSSIFFMAAKKEKVLCIAHSHINYAIIDFKIFLKRLIALPIKFLADYFFACSKVAGICLYGKRILKDKRFIVLNNSIDTKHFVFNPVIRKKNRKAMNLNNKFVVGHIGRFNRQKNHLFIIEIFKKIYDYNRNSVLILVGDGRLRQPIEKKALDLGLYKNVIFTGVRSDIPEMLQVMDVFLFPSLYEGLGVALVEAQASGLKCFVSDTITKEVKITDQIEFISLNKTPEYWAKQILKYSKGYERKNAYKTFYNAGYDINKNAKWLESFYLKKFRELQE
jgi:glycosyltransferase involved in cell wall biosynthesis